VAMLRGRCWEIRARPMEAVTNGCAGEDEKFVNATHTTP